MHLVQSKRAKTGETMSVQNARNFYRKLSPEVKADLIRMADEGTAVDATGHRVWAGGMSASREPILFYDDRTWRVREIVYFLKKEGL